MTIIIKEEEKTKTPPEASDEPPKAKFASAAERQQALYAYWSKIPLVPDDPSTWFDRPVIDISLQPRDGKPGITAEQLMQRRQRALERVVARQEAREKAEREGKPAPQESPLDSYTGAIIQLMHQNMKRTEMQMPGFYARMEAEYERHRREMYGESADDDMP
ncbi:hypothetical protein PWT90_04874 [Aphanocladium album]|nr:hypothetical protein PWT90_04874 [Aphanocladium album]